MERFTRSLWGTALVLPLALACGICHPASANTVYVNKNATGSTHDGTSWAKAFLTVQAGINAAVAGDEVWVAASTPAAPAYVENITMKSGVALYGGFAGTETQRNQRNWAANVTILDGNDGTTVWAPSTVPQLATLDGFTIRSGNSYGVYVSGATVAVCNDTITGSFIGVRVSSGTTILAGNSMYANYNRGVYLTGGTTTLTNNAITDNGSYGVDVESSTATLTYNTISGNGSDGIYVWDGKVTLANNTFTDNSGNGVSVSGEATLGNNALTDNTSGGVYARSGSAALVNNTVSGSPYGVFVDGDCTATLTNNTISGNAGPGVSVAGVATLADNAITYNTRPGVDVFEEGTATLDNNTITGNSSGVRVWDGGTASLTNNIVAFNRIGVYELSGTISPLSHNDVYGNTTDGYYGVTAGTTDIAQDPLFVDLAGGNYHVHAGSPCIDAGDDSVVTPGETDRDRNPRITGAHVDMGAYEYSGAAVPYTIAEAIGALKVAGGLVVVPAGDVSRLDTLPDAVIDLRDAVRIARKVAGLEANP